MSKITHGDIEERYEHLRRCYMPFIEELIWGRRFLDVGFMVPSHIEALRKRGWVTKGIDLIKTRDQIRGDFEEYDFNVTNDSRYDLIWMGHVLQCFNNPLLSLVKAYRLLKPGGGLFISSPDAEQIWETTVEGFGHWEHTESHFFFSERELVRQLKGIGYDVLFRLKNRSRRFLNWNDMHILAVKPSDADARLQ